MLILVGVTVTVSLNGGLFKKSKTATINTQIEAEKEQLLSAVIGAIGEEAEVNFDELDSNLPNGWTVTAGTYTSPNGNTFIVNKDGTIEETWKNNGDGTYTKGDQTVTVGQTTFTNNEVLEKLGITESTGTYKGEWTVIGAEGDKLKLVTTRSVGSQKLGYNDPGAIAAIAAVDEDSPTDEEKLERAIWSYKNAVDTLDTKAKKETGIESARSIKIEDIYDIIGEENVNKGKSYGTKWNYYYENGSVYAKTQTSSGVSKFQRHTFLDDYGKIVEVKLEGDCVELTDTTILDDRVLNETKKSLISFLPSIRFYVATTQTRCVPNYVAYELSTLCDGMFYAYPIAFSHPGGRPQLGF